MMKKTAVVALICSAALWALANNQNLIEKGKTDHVIVVPDQPDVGNQFALKELQSFLKKASGADFKSVPSSKAPGSKRIFLGLSDAALKVLGKEPRTDMGDQDTRIKTVGNDLFLFGKGS